MNKSLSFWCPYVGDVGTIKAVLEGAKSLSQSNNFNCKIINVFGEFDKFRPFLNKYNIKEVRLLNNTIINIIPSKGFFWSRVKYALIFVFSFFPLLQYLKKNSNDYLFIYLITSLPLIIVKIFNLKNKVILRVSGKIKFTIFRKFILRFCKSKILRVLVQTTYSKKIIQKQNIFKPRSISLIYDPIIDLKKINKLKNVKIDKKYLKKKYFISIGRLSYQKNFIFLIKCIKKIFEFEKNFIFLILGDGEEKKIILNLIKEKKLIGYIKVLGFKKNVYKYIKNSSGLICTSLWEEPGFVIQEAAACKKIILTSNCHSGPEEFLDYGKNGYIFNNNDEKNFIKIFKEMLTEKKTHKLKIKNNFKKIYLYSHERFSSDITKTLN